MESTEENAEVGNDHVGFLGSLTHLTPLLTIGTIMFTSPRQKHAESYAQIITKTPELTLEQELELFTRWSEHGDIKARDRLVMAALKVAVAMGRRFAARNNDFDDLLGVGGLGVMRALEKFDPKRGKKLSAYAWNWIRSYVSIWMLNSWSASGNPGVLRTNKLFDLIKRRRRIECTASDREEIIDQLAQEMGRSRDQIIVWLDRVDTRDLSLDYKDPDCNKSLYGIIADKGPNPEAAVMEKDRSAYLKRQIANAMEVLDAREKNIIRRRLLCDERESLAEIGRSLGVTRERARQLEERALKKLRKVISIDGKVPATDAKHDAHFGMKVVRIRKRASKVREIEVTTKAA